MYFINMLNTMNMEDIIMNSDKNRQIAQTMKETLERHSSMECRTFETKAVSNKLNINQKECINGIFREAKWIRNAYISDKETCKGNIREIPVKVGKDIELRKLEYIGSQIKQSVVRQVNSEIKSLSSHKKKGYKVGYLKYRSACNSVDLKQYGVTYDIDFDHNRIRVQSMRKPIYVKGLKQIPQDAEICNARMVRKPSGLYFYITCYIPKKESVITGKKAGIDFGIEHNLTLSDGTTYDICVPENKAIRLASKRLNKSFRRNGENRSNNHYKRIRILQKAYEKDRNIRKDKANKTVHNILNNYDFIAIQDEMIHNWHSGLFGKQVQCSAMGIIKAKLKKSSKVFMVERFYPSTQICPICGCLTKHSLDKREYNCAHCGYHHPSRDIKSAQSILDEALRQVSMEHRTNSPVELKTSGADDLLIRRIKPQAVKQEAQEL